MLAMLSGPTPTDAPSTITVKTMLRGEVAVPADHVITFVQPVLGFDRLTTFIIYQTQSGPMYWLQSLEDPTVSFCLLAPYEAGIDPDIELGTEDVIDLGARDHAELTLYTTVVLDDDPAQIRTNLRAPILVCRRTGRAKQLVINDTRLPVRLHLKDIKEGRNPFPRRG